MECATALRFGVYTYQIIMKQQYEFQPDWSFFKVAAGKVAARVMHVWKPRLRPERSALDRSAILTDDKKVKRNFFTGQKYIEKLSLFSKTKENSKKKCRRQQDSNLRAETASDFKSDPLTTRAH